MWRSQGAGSARQQSRLLVQGAWWACGGGARATGCRERKVSGMPAPSMSVLMSTPLYVGSSPRSSQMDDTMLVGTRTCARMLP